MRDNSDENISQPSLMRTVDILIKKAGLSEQLTLNKEGTEYRGICPFCKNDGFSFHRLSGMYQCQQCGSSGIDSVFVMNYKGIDVHDEISAWFWLENMMRQEHEKGRPVDMTAWTCKDN